MAGETRQQIRAEERSREKIRRKSFSPTPPAPASPAPSGKGWLPKASLSDSLGMLAFPLAAVGMLIDNMVAVGVLLFLATVIPCVAIAQHSEIKKIDRLIAGLVCGAVFFSLFFVLKSEHDKRELAKNEGLLVPSNLPRPETRCSIPENNFAIYSGGGVTYGPTRPAALLTMGGQEIISADGLDNGAIRLRTSRLYDDQNEIIARVTNNELWVHPLARRERPDFSTLIVYDRRDSEVLNIRLLNKNTVIIKGVFRLPGRPTVVVSEKDIRIGKSSISEICVENSFGFIAF